MSTQLNPYDAGWDLEEETALAELVTGFMKAFDIPGSAIAVLKEGRPPLTKGFGVRRLGSSDPVGVATQFAIGSNSKAFLAACLALLVDEGTVGWDDPVVDHLPEFRMHDECATRMMTLRDLLVHRSGLPLGAGDLMQVRAGDFDSGDVVAALRHLRPETGFRSGYAYDNCLYIVAGVVLERVSGMSWDEFVTTRIFEPLGMANALPSLVGGGAADGAGRHARLGPPVIGMGPVRPLVPEETALVSPAGGIRASVADAVPWLETLLGQGERRDGRRLWSRAQAAEMWKAQTIIASGPGPSGDAPQRPVLEAYALGWGVTDYRGRRLITHGGLVAGQATRTALLPEEGIAVAIYTNSSEADAVSAMRYAVLDFLIDAPQFNWLGAAIEQQSKNRREVEMALADQDLRKPDDQLSLPLEHYAGRYRDAWYGDVIIQHKEGRLDIVFVPTPAFTGGLEPIGNDRFRTRFASELSEDAVLQFAVRDGQVERLTMQALSPIADFSFDFHHLDLFPVDA